VRNVSRFRTAKIGVQRLLRFQAEDTPNEKLGKLEQMLSQYRLPVEESVPLLAPLLSLALPENRYPLLNLSPQRQRQKALEAIVAIFLELAEHHPVLFIVEDLHWTDPTTLDLLNLVIDQTPTAALFALFTCRPHFQPSWTHRSYLTEVSVTRLAQPHMERMTTHVAGGKPLPAQVLTQIIEKTDGVPLFVEEITKTVLESGHLKEVDAHYALTGSFSTFAIPATLQDSLMARLDRLVTAKAVAQYAAVSGRQRIGKSNGIFALVSPGAHPRNPTAWTPPRLGVPLPAPARRLAGCGGQPAPWRMRRLALGLPFLACLILAEVFSLLLYICAV
jgi:predicted ATPase